MPQGTDFSYDPETIEAQIREMFNIPEDVDMDVTAGSMQLPAIDLEWTEARLERIAELVDAETVHTYHDAVDASPALKDDIVALVMAIYALGDYPVVFGAFDQDAVQNRLDWMATRLVALLFKAMALEPAHVERAAERYEKEHGGGD